MWRALGQKIAAAKQALVSSLHSAFLRERILPELEKFLIAGPMFVGFALGLVRYPPGSVAFETGFQSLVFFSAYLIALSMMQLLDSLFLSNWPLVLGVARSLLAAFYLALTIKQYVEWRNGAVQIYGSVKRLRERLRSLFGNAF